MQLQSNLYEYTLYLHSFHYRLLSRLPNTRIFVIPEVIIPAIKTIGWHRKPKHDQRMALAFLSLEGPLTQTSPPIVTAVHE